MVKSNGVPVMEHTVLNHKYSPGETALICRKCRANFSRMEGLTGQGGNWKIGETVEVERPAREYETPLLKAFAEMGTERDFQRVKNRMEKIILKSETI